MAFVRVSDPVSGMHVTVGEEYAESVGLKPLKSPATHNGRFLPPTKSNGRRLKPKTSVAKAAADKAAKRGDVVAEPTPEEASK